LIKVRGRPVSHAHRASAKWEEEFETLASWFEAGEAVERLLQPLRMRKRRIEAVSTQLLPDILGRTLRLDGSNAKGGQRRRGSHL
jgi:vacuolar-type H+-ATPase subunit D/Vma8